MVGWRQPNWYKRDPRNQDKPFQGTWGILQPKRERKIQFQCKRGAISGDFGGLNSSSGNFATPFL
jgi:hypothetical protein